MHINCKHQQDNKPHHKGSVGVFSQRFMNIFYFISVFSLYNPPAAASAEERSSVLYLQRWTLYYFTHPAQFTHTRLPDNISTTNLTTNTITESGWLLAEGKTVQQLEHHAATLQKTQTCDWNTRTSVSEISIFANLQGKFTRFTSILKTISLNTIIFMMWSYEHFMSQTCFNDAIFSSFQEEWRSVEAGVD